MSAERNAVRIGSARPYDAAALLELKRQLDEVEGRRSECLLVDGQFIDELTMAVILPARG